MTEFITPVGRVVQGSCIVMQDRTDDKGQPVLDKSGNVQRIIQISLAIEKTNPEWPAFEALVWGFARQVWPQQFGPDGRPFRQDFAIKIIDGDSPAPDRKGRAWNTKEGFAGHWVVKLGSNFPPRVFPHGKYNPADQITASDHAAAKRGHYVRISGKLNTNGSQQTPGIHINPELVEFMGYGTELVSGPSAQERFGAAPAAYMPQGVSQVPTGATSAPPPVQQAAYAPPAGAAPAYAPPAPPVAPPPQQAPAPGTYAPNHAFVQQAVQQPPQQAAYAPPVGAAPAYAPPAPPVAPPPAAAPAKQMTAKAQGATYDSFISNGWTDAAMIDQGYLLP